MKVFPTAYLAPISYYQQLLKEREVEIEHYEWFEKRTERNRCVIAGPNGVQTLTVPVEKNNSKQLTKDVRISYQSKWQREHWNALTSAYQHTPFFEYLQDEFRPFYEKETTYLVDLNAGLNELILRIMQKGIMIKPTPEWRGENLESVWRGECPTYYQIFADRQGFQQNLSVVDWVFNMGTERLT